MATIWGTNPKGERNKVFAIHIPKNDVAEIIQNGKRDGWKDLTTEWNPTHRLLGESESSESPASTEPKPSDSHTSGVASRASATRSTTSRRRVQRKRSRVG